MTTSPLKVEDSRAQFEAWFSSRKESMKRCGLGMIAIRRAHDAAWSAWQASRAAIVVDIDWPEANDDTWKEGVEGAYAMGHEDGKDKVVIAVRQGLRAAGITVKGD